MDDVEKKDRAERYKLSFDLLKHLTTLSSGSVILILTLADRLSKTAQPVGFLWYAVVCFCLVIALGMLPMAILAVNINRSQPSVKEANFFAISATFAFILFFVGMGVVGASAIKQLGIF